MTPHAADDAFQATFLVLVRRARSIRDRDRLGNWLYGVAVRVSRKANAQAARRRTKEREAAVDPAVSPAPEPPFDPLHATMLHEELAKLPAKYRAPLVLCFLDGQTHDQAAAQLGWPIGTVKGRISRAKSLLRTRLTRRGVTLSTAAMAATLTESARAAVPPILLNQTLQAAMLVAAGGTIAAGASSAAAVLLSREVVSVMTLTKLKLAAIALVSLGTVATGAGVMARQGLGGNGQESKSGGVGQKVAEPPKQGAATDPHNGDRDMGGGVFKHKMSAEEVAARDGLSDLLRGFQPPPSEPLDLPPIPQLLANRVEMARLNANLVASQYQKTGRVPMERMTAVVRTLREAAMDAATTDAERIQAMEESIRALRGLVAIADRNFRNGTSNISESSGVQFQLADAELALARARKGSEKSKTEAAEGKPGTPSDERPSDDPDTDRKITEALNATIGMPFEAETPLEDVVKYIHEQTAEVYPPSGIPIYFDPMGIKYMNQRILPQESRQDVIRFNQSGLKLKTSLRLMLNQLGLAYYVQDGLLVISSPNQDAFPDSALSPRQRERRNQSIRPGMMGGFGAGMGGFGGAASAIGGGMR